MVCPSAMRQSPYVDGNSYKELEEDNYPPAMKETSFPIGES